VGKPFFELPRRTRLELARGLVGHPARVEHCPHRVIGERNRLYIATVLAVATIPLTTVTPDLIVLDIAGTGPHITTTAVPLDQVSMLLSYQPKGQRCTTFNSHYGSCELTMDTHEAPCHFGQRHGNHLGSWYA
jgi:hypothetical protein